jgi:hypothetical protein
MIKKTVKLMVAISIATGFGMSSFMESAEARKRKGNDYSQAGENEQFVEAQFSLVNATREGIPIVDDNISLSIGLFIGAIENYDTVKEGGEICRNFIPNVCPPGSNSSPFNADTRYLYDSSGFPILKSPLSLTGSPFDGNLLAQFVEPGQERYFVIGGAPTITSPAAIAYSIFRADSIPGADEPVFSYRLLNLDGLDIRQAVNSLEYILENNLLGAARPVAGRFPDSDTEEPALVLGIGDALVQNQFEEDVPPTAVPEPDTTIASVLCLGVFGAGSLLKRKMKPS